MGNVQSAIARARPRAIPIPFIRVTAVLSLLCVSLCGCATKVLVIYDANTLRETGHVSIYSGYPESFRGARDDIQRFCTLQRTRDKESQVFRERDYCGNEVSRKTLPLSYRGNGYDQPAVSPDWREIIYLDNADKRLKKMSLADLSVEVVAEPLTKDDRSIGALFWISNDEVFLEIEPSYDLEDKRRRVSEAVKINVRTRELKRVVLPGWLQMWDEGISPLRDRCALTDDKAIYIMNLSDMVVERKIDTRKPPGHPIWSYDGAHILYRGLVENSLNLYDLKTGVDRMVKQIHPSFGMLTGRAMGESTVIYYFGEKGDPYREYIRVLNLRDSSERTMNASRYGYFRLIDGGRKILAHVDVY